MILFLLSLASSVNLDNYVSLQCGANIDGNVYNFSEISKQIGISTKILSENASFTFSLCNMLEESVFPQKNQYKPGIAAFRNTSDSITYFGFSGSQYVELIDIENPSVGANVIYYQEQNDKNEKSHLTVFNLVCDSTVEEVQFESIDYEISKSSEAVIISYKSKFACPTQGSVQFNHAKTVNCFAVSPIVDGNISRIDLNKYNLQSGHTIVTNDGNLVFYQPCGLISCPATYTCNKEISSIWYCNEKTCNSYGSINDSLSFEFDAQITHAKYSEASRKAIVNFNCNNSISKQNPLYKKDSHIESDTLTISVDSLEACPINDDPPGLFYFERHGNRAVINVSNQTYIGQTEFPVQGDSNTKIYLNPTQTVNCPQGYTCSSHRPSNAWACSNGNCKNIWFSDSKPLKASSNVTMQSNSNLYYEGEDNTMFQATFSCSSNFSLKYNKIGTDDTVVIYDQSQNLFKIEFTTRQLCNIDFIPPEFRKDPAPTPNVPAPKYIYSTNGTHSIKIAISSIILLEQEVKLKTIPEYGKTDVKLFVTPFANFGCPFKDACLQTSDADAYVCFDKGNKTECISAAYLNYGYSWELIDPSDISEGVTARFKGADYSSMVIRMICSGSTEFLIYTEPSTFNIKLQTDGACPKPWIDPTPPPHPLPIDPPPSDEVKPFTLEANGTEIKLDDKTYISGDVMIETNKVNQSATFIAYPGSYKKPKQCNNVFDATNATVWKCWMSTTPDPFTCVNVADGRYGYTKSGNNVTYWGGYENKSVTLSFVCGEDKGLNESFLYFANHAIETDDHLYLTVETPKFCVTQHKKNDNIAIYVLIIVVMVVALSFLLYLLIGSLIIRKKSGTCDIPNKPFWSGCIRCCCCCSCGRKSYSDNDTEQFISLN